MTRLDGRVAVVTGAARGQGAAEAGLLAGHGARTFVTDLRDVEGRRTATSIGAEFLHHDVTSERQWSEVLAEVLASAGRIDVLVNNAGILVLGGLSDTTLDTWERAMAVNATGAFLGMRAVAPAMVGQGSGSIVNISSVSGLAGSMSVAYGASKWALRGLSRSAARELAPHNVRVNTVHPGVIDTAMMSEAFGPQWPDTTLGRIPMGRAGTVDDVARLVLFLASDDSSYATGQEFVVDGGITA